MSNPHELVPFDTDILVDTLHEPVLALDAQLRVRKANGAFYRAFQLTPDETVGQRIHDLCDRQWCSPALQRILEDILAHRTDYQAVEIEHDFPRIGRKTVILNARRLSSGNNLTDHVILALEDITERRRSRHFAFSHDLFCVATLDGYFVDVNPAFERVLGYTRADLLAKPFYEFIHPDDRDKTAMVVSQLGRGNDLAHFQNRYRCKDGTYRSFDWTCPAPQADERYLYSAARDITELLEVEKDRKRLHSELARSNADLEQFAYVASHDLQEPLRAVSGCVQIIQRRFLGQLDANADELICHTVEGATRMQTLINDLLEYSRVSRRGGEFKKIDLSSALDEALKSLETSLRETKAVLTRDPLPRIAVDRGQMIRLFQNLLGNALKFHGPARPTIHVGAHREGEAWCISIRDNGIGIASEYFDRIFALFQRLHTRKEYPGTGIGLAICKKIVERHGGRIFVESEPDVGTTFSFTIPDTEPGS
ncbi:MAG: ATP-binding protein [Pirellulaceae bacterium]|nr:ATP-binding protein [Pirellulaceae bacterium]